MKRRSVVLVYSLFRLRLIETFVKLFLWIISFSNSWIKIQCINDDASPNIWFLILFFRMCFCFSMLTNVDSLTKIRFLWLENVSNTVDSPSSRIFSHYPVCNENQWDSDKNIDLSVKFCLQINACSFQSL